MDQITTPKLAPTLEECDALEAKHGRIFLYPFGCEEEDPEVDPKTLLTNSEYVFVVRAPTKPEFDRYSNDVLKDDKRAAAIRALAQRSIVWPDNESADGMKRREQAFNDYPGAIENLYLQALELAKTGRTLVAKKYTSGTNKLAPAT